MGSAKNLAVATAAVFMSIQAASAADLPALSVPMPHDPGGAFAGWNLRGGGSYSSGWYLRGDIGMSNQQVKSLFNALDATPGATVQYLDKGFDSAPIFGLGFGYQLNSWLRFDATGEYRGKANFHGFAVVTNPAANPTVQPDDYMASKSEWLFLVNSYVDLGTWWNVTPFVGAGIGTSYNTISHFRDTNQATAGVAYGGDASKWNFAWALHAGLAYSVTPAFTVELAYRYVSLGDAQSGDLITYTGVNAINNPMEFRGLTSHDVKLGVRWMLVDPEPLPPPPLMRKG